MKIKVAVPPVDGAANEALTKFLAQAFGVAARQVLIKSGATGRSKVVQMLSPVARPESLHL